MSLLLFQLSFENIPVWLVCDCNMEIDAPDNNESLTHERSTTYSTHQATRYAWRRGARRQRLYLSRPCRLGGREQRCQPGLIMADSDTFKIYPTGMTRPVNDNVPLMTKPLRTVPSRQGYTILQLTSLLKTTAQTRTRLVHGQRQECSYDSDAVHITTRRYLRRTSVTMRFDIVRVPARCSVQPLLRWNVQINGSLVRYDAK